jgi:hypothetical protein
MAHLHQWGAWLQGDKKRWRAWKYRRDYRFCINGYCPLGQYRNGRTFAARPYRQAR